MGNLSGIRISKEIPRCKLTKEEANVAKCKEKKNTIDIILTHLCLVETIFPSKVVELIQRCLD